MSEVHPSDVGSTRVRIVLAVMLLAVGYLGAKLWGIQVARGEEYRDRVYRQTIRRVRTPGFRGRILDRNGVSLAENRPSYAVALYPSEFRQRGGWSNTINAVQERVEELAGLLGKPVQISRQDILAHISRRLPLPLLAWRDIGEISMARLAEHQISLRGVDFYVEPVRVYPQGDVAAHVIGYARGRRDNGDSWPPRDEQGRFHYYLPELRGERGVEKVYNDVLAGEAGGRLIRVDASGYMHTLSDDDVIGSERPPSRGDDVYLSIDVDVQRYVEECLANVAGAAVVLDPRNGDVLALASSPRFNPNAFIPTISLADWTALSSDPARPLLNRAVSGFYPPGSTFKPIVAIAALQNRLVEPDQQFNCPGYYQMGATRLKCWIYRYNKGHGTLAMRKAFEQSCNTYFCELGVACGYEPIFYTARAMGLGSVTGIDLDGERGGVLPTPDRIRSRGDICNVSIGQGALTVSPLQMASVTAVIATGGMLYRPRLVTQRRRAGDGAVVNIASELIEDLEWSRLTTDAVRYGMLDVVEAPRGTGKRARLDGIRMGGKTGTAEYGRKGDDKKRGWMIAFAPFDEPRYAVAIVIDAAVSGGITVSPLVRQLMQRLLFPFGGEIIVPQESPG